jgi:ADP-heptose:LPS heptosyltransferase
MEIELQQIALKYLSHVVVAHEQNWTTPEYLKAVIDYEFVISVDTSAIHIREGLSLPALGLYGAFSVDSRAKYYKHVKCIDVKNECLLSPCFNHSQKPCSENKGTNFAPCLTNYEHIETELKEYLNQLNG